MARKPKNMETEALVIADDYVIQKEFIELIDERFTNYAFAVMEDRALPDARDGLKPSQRRSVQRFVVTFQVITILTEKQWFIQLLSVWLRIGHYAIL